ncbi:MAG: bifunctional metallophosphatase/5'-nucleotidase [Candidatus Krumholzibacteriota bacterium]|nr:bifunctional metallophosphatase/5'-nucleotidase [Candidatus Krumholzibacteriota bacterium]
MNRRFALLILLLVLLPTLAGAERRPDLVIVHTNDLHAHYRSFPARDGALRGGVARIATRIEALRAEHGERLLYLDAGDLFVGTPFYHFYRGSLGMAVLTAMGCDAMALGNHELDDGPVSFLRAAVGRPFAVLCANLDWADGTPLLPADARLSAGGLDIAVVGLVTDELPELVPCVARGELVVAAPATALRRWLAADRPAADLTIALSHCGLGQDRETAAAVGAPPLFIGGHSHSFVEAGERVGAVTICQAGASGYVLGVIECFRLPDGGWDFAPRLEPVTADWPEDPVVASLVAEAGRLVDREMEIALADLPEAFPALDKDSRPDPLGILVADLMRRRGGADLGLQNIGGYRGHLPAGTVTRGRLFELLPFDNLLLRLDLRGADLQALFDHLAANHAGGRFGQIAGGSYRIADGRAEDVRVGGASLDPAASYTLVTADFLYKGGDGYGFLQAATRVDTVPGLARDLLEARLRESPPPRPGDFAPNFLVAD